MDSPGKSSLERDLSSALNRFSAENASDTPDWILAQFLLGCLAAWNNGVQQREIWYGRLSSTPATAPAETGEPTVMGEQDIGAPLMGEHDAILKASGD